MQSTLRAVKPDKKAQEKSTSKSAPSLPPEMSGEPYTDSGWSVSASDISVGAQDPLLGCLIYLTEFYGKPYSANALTSGLPLHEGILTPDMFIRAASRAGLTAKIAARDLDAIPDMVLPVVVLLDDRQACVLKSRPGDPFRPGVVRIVLPETGEETSCSSDELAKRFAGYAIFVKPVVEKTMDSDSDGPQESAGSWFWSVVRRFWPTYAQVMLAAVLVNIFSLASPMFTMNVYDRVVPNKALETLWVLAVGMIIILFFDFLLKTLRTMFVDNAGKRADILLSSRIFEHVLNLKLHAQPSSSGAFANQLREFETLREFLSSAMVISLVDLPFLFLFIGVIYMIGGPVAYVPLVAVPLVIFFGFIIQLPMRRSVSKEAKERSHKHGVIIESVAALETIKSLGAESRMQRAWERYVGEAAKTSLGLKALSGTSMNLAQVTMQSVTVGVILVGVYQIIKGEMTMGGLIACSILSGRTMAPLGQIAGLLARMFQSMDALKNLNAIMKLPVERQPGRRYLSRNDVRGNIELKDVTFRYPSSGVDVIRELNLNIKAGEKVGIIGPIGSGKTTLARLICGLYEPSDGAVLLDSTDIRQLDPADVRASIGKVLQEVILFKGSIRDNIAISYAHADDSMIFDVARLSGVHDFISQHPMGYDMDVGERGQHLSGGQRQAVGLARALLQSPPILLLDEPTSQMDMASEQAFRNRLRAIIKDKTLVLITHRPSMLQLVDRVIVVGNGKVMADGPRDTILSPGGRK